MIKCPYCEKVFDLEAIPRKLIKRIADAAEKEGERWRPVDYGVLDSWAESPDSTTIVPHKDFIGAI